MSTSSEGVGGVVVLSGNPRAGSRTVAAATEVGTRIAALIGADVATIELADLAPEIFSRERPAVDAALARVASARVLVVATPVYKASYTGLLKVFADLYRAGDLSGVVAIPVVVAGQPGHALAGEVHLRPLLVELGATVPSPSFVLTEAELPGAGEAAESFVGTHGPAIRALATALHEEES